MQLKHHRNVIFYAAIFFLCHDIHCAPLTEGNGTNPKELNGKTLVEFGITLKNPTLQLIGKAVEIIDDKICDLHHCLEWTKWSDCTARLGQFGSRHRTRQCGVHMTTCEIDTSNTTETEFDVCIKNCPKDYNKTKHGFCVKLYADVKRTQDAAEQQCQKDGGHLINIDSQTKYEDVKSLKLGIGSYDWIDGRRKDVSSPWKYKYGSQKGFFKWQYGQPRNRTYALCLKIYWRFNGNGFFWYENSCTYSYNSICEVTYY